MKHPISPTKTTALQKAFGIEIRKIFKKRLREIYDYLIHNEIKFQEDIRTEGTMSRSAIDAIKKILEKIKFDLSPIVKVFIGASWWKANESVASKSGFSGQIAFDSKILKIVQDESYGFLYKFIDGKQDEIVKILSEGISQGDSVKTIAGEIKESFKITAHKSNIIARTEVVRVHGKSTRLAIIKGRVTQEYQWLTSLKENVCVICKPLHGNIYRVDDPNAPMPVTDTHPHCFIDRQIPVLTIEGYKEIGDIEIGDLVLTKEGKYRKVTRLFNEKFYKGEVITIDYKQYQHTQNSITITPEHPIMTKQGYKEASKLTINDEIMVLAKKCKGCKKIIPNLLYSSNYCSKFCADSFTAKKQWKDMRDIMVDSVKDNGGWNKGLTKETDERVKRNAENISKAYTEEMRKNASERIRGDKNPAKTKEAREKISKIKKAGQAAYACSCNKSPSKPQLKLYNLVKKKFPNALIDEPFKIRKDRHIVMDIMLPKLKIDIEYDGWYWHQDKEKDLKRDLDVKSKGWDTIRINEDNFDKWEEILQNLLDNHNEEFLFTFIKPEKIERWKLKRNQRLYNFEVDEFNNYIAKGTVVHNCNCGITPYVRIPT